MDKLFPWNCIRIFKKDYRKNMNSPNKELLQIHLNELFQIIDLYNPSTDYLFAIVALSLMAISLIVILTVGLLWGMILLGIGFLPLLYKALAANKSHPTEKELSEQACIIMNQCVNLCKYPENDPISISNRMVLSYSQNGNLPLYQEFTALFPNMASNKLKKLASIKLRR